ncbi:MAG: 3-isopropylmalate dehydratase small subunit [Candidatus Magnetoglobus multicellularis str. Araruama]|uniref:3-isopropylmalate dehydratase n=1 Tax=Candidatus Magnetoglobus multicellularis str. Araruama TaxID=890399 RepID=A0A1V1PBW8_9BACT|nr:MAG: 3-isopropylmalate dehydratase small subunit [Candidatus Magnetoglobus multicellularis str. Araruama]
MTQTNVWKFTDDIDTDQIIATQYLVNPDIHDMAKHTLEIPRPEFASKVKPGDIIVARNNFGCGSSREQAPLVLKTLGIRMILSVSFARIFYRNCINLGIRPYTIIQPQYDLIEDQSSVTCNPQNNSIGVNDKTIELKPFPPFVEKILAAGGLIAHVIEQYDANQEKI